MMIVFIVTSLCALREFGKVKAEIMVHVEDANIAILDGRYFDAEKTTVYIVEDEETEENKVNTTFSIIEKLPAGTDVRFQVFQYSMGKYNIPTGCDVTMDLCEALDEPIFMGSYLAAIGFTKESCPPGPGNYSQEGHTPDTSLLPDTFPENKYVTYFSMNAAGKPLLVVNLYTFVSSD